MVYGTFQGHKVIYQSQRSSCKTGSKCKFASFDMLSPIRTKHGLFTSKHFKNILVQLTDTWHKNNISKEIHVFHQVPDRSATKNPPTDQAYISKGSEVKVVRFLAIKLRKGGSHCNGR